jgi:DNA-directed RNA polymerase specialized sigma24 family protein
MTTGLLIGASVIAVHEARGEQPQMPNGCAQIVAVLDAGGGGLSAEEVAKKTSTDVETVRNCTDLWRSKMKDPKAPKGASAAPQPIPEGCAQIVAVLDQGGGGLSPEEVAKKTSTDVETVRNCTDLWRRTMKAAHP